MYRVLVKTKIVATNAVLLGACALLAAATAAALERDDLAANEETVRGPVVDPAVEKVNDLGPVAVCFDAEDPPSQEEIEAIHRALGVAEDEGGAAYNLSGRWQGVPGTPIELTWSFVPDGLWIEAAYAGDDSGPSELFARMDDLFDGDRELWIGRFEETFARWAELIGTSYTRITVDGTDWDDNAPWGWSGSSDRGDIRIAMRNLLPSGVLAVNFFPPNGDMILDRDNNWALGETQLKLRNVIAHEHGHGIGIKHVCPVTQTKLMEPFVSQAFDGPQHDDLRAGQRHYGDNFEIDNGFGFATDLGIVTPGAPINVGGVPAPQISFGSVLSIDAFGENDYFRFTVLGPVEATVLTIPVGLGYDSSTQNANGSCNSGNFIDSKSIANLNAELIDTDGFAVLATANAEPAGETEVLVSVPLPVAGDYFIKVYEAQSIGPNQSQLYAINITVTSSLDLFEADPPDQAIDARQPSEPDGSNVDGWDSIQLSFTGDTSGLGVADFAVSVDPPGPAPQIVSVETDGTTATLSFDVIIPLESWTTITYLESGATTRIGYLPADVNNDKLSNANDVLTLIDSLNGAVKDPLAIYQTDIDRSGQANASDVLRVIDLLNGAGVYDVFLGATLPD